MRSNALGVAIVLLAAGCGAGPDVLATVGDREITGQDFEGAFGRLSPSEQVDVLEPGGRLALVDRLVNKALLEQALEDRGAPGSDWWVTLYEDAALSSTWTESRFEAFMGDDPRMEDFLALAGTFGLRIVLVPDSLTAMHVLDAWGEGAFEPDVEMSLAPWSISGSSHRVMSGYLWQMPVDLETHLAPHAGEGPVVIPLYGAWAVAELEMNLEAESDSVPPEAALSAFNRTIRRELAAVPSSRAIEELAGRLAVSDGRYTLPDTTGIARDLVLATYSGGSVTTGDMADIITRTDPWNFFGNPPVEISSLVMPRPSGMGAGVDLWFHVISVAQTRWAAARAREEQMDAALGETAMMASVEHLLRLEILERVSEPDSAEIIAWYESNTSRYSLPERRSALLAYVPESAADSIGTPESFEALLRWTPVDSTGAPFPTPPQPAEAFGSLAEPVFSSSEGTICGPFEIGVEGARAYFQVVGILPVEPAGADQIWDILRDDCRAVRIQDAYLAFISELRNEMGVEIDTSAVERVDPWSDSF